MTVTPRRVVKRSAAARAAIPEPPSPLDEGDTIEFGMTVEYKHPRKGAFWPKFSVSGKVRPGETPEQAKERLVAFVLEGIQEQISEIQG